ncbi:inner centromere protein A isoform X2 [Cephus cinctus]|uniref:Inner centromere protein A isoform X2 n=1 Tax=Cephus cinctus TaxID=211228 RepID=A0AAJ7C952_CEPCN|nr:inner centromere protein A isoform X2 [Cephus cinctus]
MCWTRVKCCIVMANDCDLDNWELRQEDDLVQLPHRNALTLPTITKFINEPSTQNGLHRHWHNRAHSTESGPELRFINPAIYAESLEDGDEVEPGATSKHHSIKSEDSSSRFRTNCGDSQFADCFSTLSINEESGADCYNDQQNPRETYRCANSLSATSSTFTLTNQSKSSRVERRCAIGDGEKIKNGFLNGVRADNDTSVNSQPDIQRYTVNGQRRVMHYSSTSLSGSTVSEQHLSGVALARKLAHKEWVKEKERMVQRKKSLEHRAEERRKAEEEKVEREREERRRKERESFIRWAERKRKEDLDRRKVIESELELQKRLKEVEERATMAKTIYLKQWARKKEEEYKAQQKELQLKDKQAAEGKKKRLEESLKAYEKWRERSKNRPKPATQGLLPHQKAVPAYVNPTPWQRLVDDANSSDEGQRITDLAEKKSIAKSNSNNIKKNIRSKE